MRLFVLIPTSVLLCRNERAEKRLLIWKADALLRRWCRFRESRLVENEMEDNLNFPSLIGFLYGCEIEFSPLGNFLFFPPILGTKIQMLSIPHKAFYLAWRFIVSASWQKEENWINFMTWLYSYWVFANPILKILEFKTQCLKITTKSLIYCHSKNPKIFAPNINIF